MRKSVVALCCMLFLSCSIISNTSGSSGELVTLSFIQPAGLSPKIFTEGWVFGAECLLNSEIPFHIDVSSGIHWSGSGKFYPEYGPVTYPVFESEGINYITIECIIDGKSFSKTMTVNTVMPDYYACVGDYVYCPFCSHGNPCCPHTVVGQIGAGSPTVKVRGKPAARVGDGGMHAACCGSNNFTIVEGDESVLIDGKPAAKIGSATEHCGGKGIITFENVRIQETSSTDNGKKKNEKKPQTKINTSSAFYPAEPVPQEYIERLPELKKNADPEKFLKTDGPDYSLSKMEMFDKVNEIFGLESASLSFLGEVGGIECLEKINGTCGKLGIMFSVIQIVNNVYEGKKTDAVYNTLKTAGYYAIDCGWSSLKIASFGLVIIDYTLNKFMKEMIDSKFNAYKKGYYNFYSDKESGVKRDFKAWKNIINDIYEKSERNKEEFQILLDRDVDQYLSIFWNSEMSGFYLPNSALLGELSAEEKKTIQDSYKKEMLSPMFNAISVGFVEKEKMKIEKQIQDEFKNLIAQYNTKFRFSVRVEGPADKIKKINVRIGEWSGLTNDKGLWEFDATLYACMKNGMPDSATFTLPSGEKRVVKFKINNKTDIVFKLPKPVSINLSLALSKETEGAGYSAMASALNFDEMTIQSETLPVSVEWDWKLNGTLISSSEGNVESSTNQISGVIEEAGDYIMQVELINKTEGTQGYNNPIASASKKFSVKKDPSKDIAKKDEELRKQKEEELRKQKEEELKKEQERKSKEEYNPNIIPMSGGFANYRYKNDVKINVFVPVGDRGKFNGVYNWIIKKGWNDVISSFQGSESFIFPIHESGFYVIEVKNSGGDYVLSKPLTLE